MDPYERVRRICTALPEVVETAWEPGLRWKVRNRIFADAFEWDGSPPMLVVLVDPDEREFLVRAGHPWFALGNTDKRIGVVLEPATDWTEIAELVTESYRRAAPKKLVALLALAEDEPVIGDT